MGFFSRLRSDKQVVEQAREAMQQPGFAEMVRSAQESYAQMQQGGGMQHMLEDAQRAATIASSGIPTPAVVKSVEREAQPNLGGGAPPGFGPAGEAPATGLAAMMPPQARIQVEVQPEGKPAYEATFTQTLAEPALAMLKPGAKITVRVDPNDPSSMLFWGIPV